MAYSKEVGWNSATAALSEVIIEKLTCPTDNPPKKRKERSGVSQKLYKPFHESLAQLNIINIIAALALLIGNTCPEPGFLRITLQHLR